MKLKVTTERVIMLATLGVGIIGLFLLYKKRKKDKKKDKNGGIKSYPVPISNYLYEEMEDVTEAVCDRVFRGKCKQECANGPTELCQECLVICEKEGIRL